MAGFGPELIDTPPSHPKKRKWSETGLLVLLSVIVAFFLLNVLNNSIQLFFKGR